MFTSNRLYRMGEKKPRWVKLIEALQRGYNVLAGDPNGQTDSDYEYPPEYRVKTVAEQGAILRELFPQLSGVPMEQPTKELPLGAEGWFLIPRWQRLVATYPEAANLALKKLETTRLMSTSDEVDAIPFDAACLRQHRRTIKKSKRIDQPNSDYIILAAQFGLRYRGCNVRRARHLFQTNEWGLGLYAVSMMLLTHPKRIVDWRSLRIMCPGDFYTSNDECNFMDVLCFEFNDEEGNNQLELRRCMAHDGVPVQHGPASAFL